MGNHILLPLPPSLVPFPLGPISKTQNVLTRLKLGLRILRLLFFFFLFLLLFLISTGIIAALFTFLGLGVLLSLA